MKAVPPEGVAASGDKEEDARIARSPPASRTPFWIFAILG